MKVLKKGRPQKEWSKKFTCTGSGNGGGGCGALLLVGKSDLFQTSRGYIDGSTDYFITFKCPECEVKTDIPDMELPRRLRAKPCNDD
jgi:hypothetical protein